MESPLEETPAHLVYERSGRGFAHLPSLQCKYGSRVRVYESSSAEGPHVWLAIDSRSWQSEPEPGVGHAHMPLSELKKLRDQIDLMLNNHYQGPYDPDEPEDEEE